MAEISTSREVQIAAMLNMFEYLDYHMGDPGTDFRTLVGEAERYLVNNPSQMTESKEIMLMLLKEGLDNIPGLADLRLQMSDHGNGIEADAFLGGSREAYVVYRGTGDGKWIDNGRGMTAELTGSQEQASDFYDRVVTACGLDEDTNLIVTGHSKGGNNAQTATLNADNRSLIDQCISFDGQGMSDAAVERYSNMPGYEEQRRKIYGINGENDVVNELGIKVIPDENTVYIKTNTDSAQLAETHMLEYLFHREDGTFGLTLNAETEQNVLGRYANRLSEILMSMPAEMRDSCAVMIMQLIELPEEMSVGYDGDHATFTDAAIFLDFGIPAVLYSLIGTEEGRDALCEILKDTVTRYVEENGVWKTIGVVTAAVMISPVVVPVIWPLIQTAGVFLEGLALAINVMAALEQLGRLLEEIGEYIRECLETIEEFFARISDWVKSRVTGRPVIESGDFAVNLDALYGAAEELRVMQNELSRAAAGVSRVRQNLAMHGAAAAAVKAYLSYVAFGVTQTSGRVELMKKALNSTANLYERYELRITENAPVY